MRAAMLRDLIDAGKIVSDGHGGVVYGGRRFSAMVYFGPEYSTTASLKLLESFVATGGKLLLDGVATRDFDGKDIKGRFAPIAAKAVGTTFAVDALPKLGVPALALEGGARYEDGSVVLTDLYSILGESPASFSVTVGSYVFTGSYAGLLALYADDTGRVVKLAAGSLQERKRDGVSVVELSKPAEVGVGPPETASTAVRWWGIRSCGFRKRYNHPGQGRLYFSCTAVDSY